jgi:CubicO group peptidase (beta-lactamase class C family)
MSYLQQVVERLAGVRLDRYLAHAVLRPLGMDDSSFEWQELDEGRVAVGHTRGGQPRPPFRPSQAKAAAGGLFTTAPDYLRFLVHSLAHSQAMFEPQARIDDGLAWGLGWGVEEGDDGRAVWQWGNDPGYKNFVIGRPADGQGVVVFTNGDRGAAVYAEVVRRLLPGPHPSLETRRRPRWMLALAGRPAISDPVWMGPMSGRCSSLCPAAKKMGSTALPAATAVRGLGSSASWSRSRGRR